MKRTVTVALVLAWLSVSATYAWVRVRSEIRPNRPPVVVVPPSTTKHTVTPEMAGASLAMLDRAAPEFSRSATDGQVHRLAELLRNGPVLLTFIKDGCPCSEAAQPYFNRLHDAYPRVAVLGVIDVDDERARSWATRFRVPYPLLIDPGLDIVRSFGAENSAYAVLIDSKGRIRQHWPGYSEKMLRGLGTLLAGLTGTSEVPLDLTGAPSEMYSGCPYPL